MKLSPKGLNFIKRFEGFKPYWYDDFTKKEWKGEDVQGTLTIGYGHTKGTPVIGQRITEAEGLKLLREDAKFAEDIANRVIKRPLKQNEFDSIVSWVFNTGRSSSDLFTYINTNSPKLEQFWTTKYITSKGKFLKGLQRRRLEEWLTYSAKGSVFIWFVSTFFNMI